jgi:hypothetical protein
MQSPLAWPPRPSDKIDAAVAGFAGLALAFAFVAMPDGIFESLIIASGLPNLVPAAAPPLGQTARGAVAVAAGIGGFLLLFLLLRALGGKSRPARSRRVDKMISPAPPPRVRRADAHPDAPARAPLLAGAELGEPFSSPIEPLELDQEAEEEPVDLPWRMNEEVAEAERAWPTLDRDQVALARRGSAGFSSMDDEPLPGLTDLPQHAAEDDFDVSRLPEWEQQEVRAPAVDALPQVAKGSDGIPDLVARFERGLRRRAAAPQPLESTSASASFPTPAPDPLADAISGLERLASKHG